jgi:hypothetical protein
VAKKKQLTGLFSGAEKGLTFVHALAMPGNAAVPNIPVHHLEIKKRFMDSIVA